ncbi:MAG: hypothetical protein HZB26_14960 [Candidatus Hydrogenedentes bacterium]|nr:hypothetical protein [Candidatus Hydrogenedentota bacterium]
MASPVSRHEFLESLFRRSMIAGLFGVGIAAVRGKKTVSECFNENYCASCWAYDGCALPEKKEKTDE